MDRIKQVLAPGVLALLLLPWGTAAGQVRPLAASMRLLRSGTAPEWAVYAGRPAAPALTLRFTTVATGARTLRLQQRDVKQAWRVLLNDRPLGLLVQDENAMVVYWTVPPGSLVRGQNTLRVEPAGAEPDDVVVGEVALLDGPAAAVLGEAAVEVDVVDAETGAPLPARLTVVDAAGVLRTVGAATGGLLAVRPGMVYTGDGHAAFGLPAGRYILYAGRGFEYGVDTTALVLRPGDRVRRRLVLRREVPTEGWVAADPHVHTLTYSGHGDATLDERLVTLAGEGVELPVMTDHNVQVDAAPAAERLGMHRWFTPVTGNEVTTGVGHFNVFPLDPAAPPPPHEVADWAAAARGLGDAATDGVVILNHARDVHRGFRPFGPARHLAPAGRDLAGWVLPANAMEVVNSGSQQTDPLRLFEDWLGMLNRGAALTPVGASDSHDVGRYLVGQARTYVRTPDADPGRLDVAAAVDAFRQGRVMVGFGLLAALTVDGRSGPGDLAAVGDSVAVTVQVLGPGWTRAERVGLYQNGLRVREAAVGDAGRAGVKAEVTWRLPRPAHDVHLVALAEGPGGALPFWPVALPYQPASPAFTPRLVGVSGAVWLDADGDGRRTSAHGYARALVDAAAGDLRTLVDRLASYDGAVAVQAAALLHAQGLAPEAPPLTEALARAAPPVRRGFQTYADAWAAAQAARSDR